MNKFYDDDYDFNLIEARHEKTKILIEDMDTFEAASLYADQSTCCLNFASSINPGGGYEAVKDLPIKIRTQEEDLFRRSNLPELTRDTIHFYPLDGLKGIYTADVEVAKDSLLKECSPFKTSLISVAAVAGPSGSDYDLVKKKIDRILSIAHENYIDILILGAWGCGAFSNSASKVANFFNEFLNEDYWGVFKEVIFAIPDKNSFNHKVFQDKIKTK